MANNNVTTAAENPLCARLKTKFDARGINGAVNRAGVQTGTYTRVRKESAQAARVKNIADPFETTARFEAATPRAKTKATAETVRFEKLRAEGAEGAAKRRVAAYEQETPFATGAYSAAYQRAAAIRARAYDGTEARKSFERQTRREELARGPKPFTLAWIKGILFGEDDEVKVKQASIAPSFIIGLVIFALVVMMIVFSFAQISEFKKEISMLETKKEALACEIDQLELDIDLKNDIRLIEKTATEEIGMVKSNRVESKYISVAKGSRIEVPEGAETAKTDYGVFNTLMSAANTNWNKIMEYID